VALVSIGVKLLGVPEFEAALKAMTAAADAATRAAVAQGGHLIESETKKNLSIGSHGRGEPTTSAPGTPPDLVTGGLRRSVKVDGPTNTGPYTWTSSTGPTAVYGRIQEMGGVTGRGGATVLPARPYLGPALQGLITSGQLGRVYTDAWRAAISRP